MGSDGIGGESRVGEGSGEATGELEIRGAEPTDLDALTQLVERVLAHPWRRGQLESALLDPAARASLALVRGRRKPSSLVGFVLARRIADLLEIDLVGVDPTRRRRGLARRLLEDLIRAERASGAREMRLELAASNAAARALYERLGFVVVGRRSRYYPDGDDALLLTLV